MDSKFFEDIVALFESESFSQAAKQRNISQSAFSRRIQKFEHWCGFEVVDRSKQPIRIHSAIESHILDIKTLIHNNEKLKQSIRSQSQKNKRLIITTQHTLALSHLPHLLQQNLRNKYKKQDHLDGDPYRIRTLNRQAAIAYFLMNQSDVLLIFSMPNEKLDVLTKFPNQIIDTDDLIAVISPSINFEKTIDRIAYLGYPQESYFHQVLKENIRTEIYSKMLQRITYESAVTENLRHMCLLSNGFTYLPKALINKDLATNQLIDISDKLGGVQLNVVIYTKKSEVLNALVVGLGNKHQ